MLNTTYRRVGVFIDVQNMYYSARHLFGQKVQFANIVKETVGDAQLIRALAYTISTEEGQEEAFFKALRAAGIEVMSKDLQEFHSGAKKGDWDVGITLDIIRMLDMVDVVVLVSGDGDFAPLVEYIKHRGRIAHVASFRESTSSMLVEAADVYTNLSEYPELFLIGERRARRFARPVKSQQMPGNVSEDIAPDALTDQPGEPAEEAPLAAETPGDSRKRRISF